jgi:hypothetical protein
MLRIRKVVVDGREAGEPERFAAFDQEAPEVLEKDQIVRDFADPYLELVRLLREASEIEHALLVQYLYAAFSVKPQYPLVMGFGFPNASDLLGVAVQEMQHLHQVNRLLVALRATPNLIRQDFPYEPDIYPFELNLEPLGPGSIAKYVYTEASMRALDREDPSNAAQRPFLDRLFEILGDVRLNHLGSLYGTTIDVMHENLANPPSGLPDLSGWPARLEQIKSEGEDAHFRFFRDLFMGTHSGFGGRSDIWSLPPSDPDYPAYPLPINPSAFEGHAQQITDPAVREVGWLSNLHYWIVLALLDFSYRYEAPVPMGLSKAHMTGPLLFLGKHLAALGVGTPFDPLSMGYVLGVDRTAALRLLSHLVSEADRLAQQIRERLPGDFPFAQTQQTLSALEQL